MYKLLLACLIVFSCEQKTNKGELLILNEDINAGDYIEVLNHDKTPWAKIYFFDEDFSKSSIPADFFPFAFKPEDFLLVFRVKNWENGFATVVVNEEDGKLKFIDINCSKMKNVTWDQFLVNNVLSLSIKNDKIRIYRDSVFSIPCELSNSIDFDLKPIKLIGNKLKVSFDVPSQTSSSIGWISFEQNQLRDYEFYYFQ